jgi:hypothetical protein
MQINVAIVVFVFMVFSLLLHVLLEVPVYASHVVKRRSTANRLTRDGDVAHALVRAASALVPTPAC